MGLYNDFLEEAVDVFEKISETAGGAVSAIGDAASIAADFAEYRIQNPTSLLTPQDYLDHLSKKDTERAIEKQRATLEEGQEPFVPFQEQCVLLENFEPIVRNNFNTAYKNFVSLHGPTGQLINSLHSRRNIAALWDITPEQLAHLQPTVRIFKVRYDENGVEQDAVELPFAEKIDKSDLSNITSSKASRGSGVNMINFDWKLQGSNPAEATNVIECSMTFRFESLQDLVRERETLDKNGGRTMVAFSDFFTLPLKEIQIRGENPAITSSKFNPDYFTFRAVVGWADLAGAYGGRRDLKELNKVLKADQKVFTLTMTRHDINFTQEGPVNITIDSIARLDMISHLQESDIYQPFRKRFAEAARDYGQAQQSAEQIDKLKSCAATSNSKTDDEKVKAAKKKVEDKLEVVQLEKTVMWSDFMKQIMDKDRVFAIKTLYSNIQATEEIRRKYLETKNTQGQSPEVINRQVQALRRSSVLPEGSIKIEQYKGDVMKPVDAAAIKELEKLEEHIDERTRAQVEAIGSDGLYTIPFIYLGDILDTALQSLHPENNKYRTKSEKTLIADIVLFDPRVKRRYSVNMADIPVSVTFFQKWFLHQVYGSKKGEVYPIKTFIKDIVEQLLPPILNPDGCFVEVPQRTIKMSTTHLTAAKKNGEDPLIPAGCNRIIVDSLLELPKPKNLHGENIMDYWIIYSSENLPPGRIANADKDRDSGIQHFYIGRDKGLIKTINFDRMDMPFMREARIVSEGDSEFSTLREYYISTIEMIGNNLFVPGDAIYINPSTIVLGSSTKTTSIGHLMGLIGYYRVIDVSSFIDRGEYKTTIKANWEAAGDGKSRSITDQMANYKNSLCNDNTTMTTKEDRNIRQIYTNEDIDIIKPRVGRYSKFNKCFETKT